jgi:hypothetical protein
MAHAVVTHLPIFNAQASHRTLTEHAADSAELHMYAVVLWILGYHDVWMRSWALSRWQVHGPRATLVH